MTMRELIALAMPADGDSDGSNVPQVHCSVMSVFFPLCKRKVLKISRCISIFHDFSGITCSANKCTQLNGLLFSCSCSYIKSSWSLDGWRWFIKSPSSRLKWIIAELELNDVWCVWLWCRSMLWTSSGLCTETLGLGKTSFPSSQKECRLLCVASPPQSGLWVLTSLLYSL